MADYGIKIAKSGFDINSSSLGNYIYHSSYPVLKIKQSGSGYTYFSSSGEITIATIPHNLGYSPMFNVLVGSSSSISPPTNFYLHSFFIVYPGLGYYIFFNVYSDNNNLYIKYNTSTSSSGYIHYKYIIYYDPINP